MGGAVEPDLRSTATTPTPTPHSYHQTTHADIEKAESTPSDCDQNPDIPRVFPYTEIKDMAGNIAKIGTRSSTSNSPNSASMVLVPVNVPDEDGTPSIKRHLPGQPRVRLDDIHPEKHWKELSDYLDENHLTRKLDGMFKWMKYVFVGFPFQPLEPSSGYRTKTFRSKLHPFFTSCLSTISTRTTEKSRLTNIRVFTWSGTMNGSTSNPFRPTSTVLPSGSTSPTHSRKSTGLLSAS